MYFNMMCMMVVYQLSMPALQVDLRLQQLCFWPGQYMLIRKRRWANTAATRAQYIRYAIECFHHDFNILLMFIVFWLKFLQQYVANCQRYHHWRHCGIILNQQQL